MVDVNKAWLDRCEFKIEEVVGRTMVIIQGECTERHLVNSIMSAVQNRVPCQTILTNYTKTGKMFKNELRVDPVDETDGLFGPHFLARSRISFLSDITNDHASALAMSPARSDSRRRARPGSSPPPSPPSSPAEWIDCEPPAPVAQPHRRDRPPQDQVAKRWRQAAISQQNIKNAKRHDVKQEQWAGYRLPTEEPAVLLSGYAPFHIVDVNDLWLGAVGYSREEAVGGTMGLVAGVLTEQRLVSGVMEAMRARQACTTVLSHYTKTGRIFRDELRIDPVGTREGLYSLHFLIRSRFSFAPPPAGGNGGGVHEKHAMMHKSGRPTEGSRRPAAQKHARVPDCTWASSSSELSSPGSPSSSTSPSQFRPLSPKTMEPRRLEEKRSRGDSKRPRVPDCTWAGSSSSESSSEGSSGVSGASESEDGSESDSRSHRNPDEQVKWADARTSAARQRAVPGGHQSVHRAPTAAAHAAAAATAAAAAAADNVRRARLAAAGNGRAAKLERAVKTDRAVLGGTRPPTGWVSAAPTAAAAEEGAAAAAERCRLQAASQAAAAAAASGWQPQGKENPKSRGAAGVAAPALEDFEAPFFRPKTFHAKEAAKAVRLAALARYLPKRRRRRARAALLGKDTAAGARPRCEARQRIAKARPRIGGRFVKGGDKKTTPPPPSPPMPAKHIPGGFGSDGIGGSSRRTSRAAQERDGYRLSSRPANQFGSDKRQLSGDAGAAGDSGLGASLAFHSSLESQLQSADFNMPMGTMGTLGVDDEEDNDITHHSNDIGWLDRLMN